jgi:hypothetical protein
MSTLVRTQFWRKVLGGGDQPPKWDGFLAFDIADAGYQLR